MIDNISDTMTSIYFPHFSPSIPMLTMYKTYFVYISLWGYELLDAWCKRYFYKSLVYTIGTRFITSRSHIQLVYTDTQSS